MSGAVFKDVVTWTGDLAPLFCVASVVFAAVPMVGHCVHTLWRVSKDLAAKPSFTEAPSDNSVDRVMTDIELVNSQDPEGDEQRLR